MHVHRPATNGSRGATKRQGNDESALVNVPRSIGSMYYIQILMPCSAVSVSYPVRPEPRTTTPLLT
jgi:hypothetical protein